MHITAPYATAEAHDRSSVTSGKTPKRNVNSGRGSHPTPHNLSLSDAPHARGQAGFHFARRDASLGRVRCASTTSCVVIAKIDLLPTPCMTVKTICVALILSVLTHQVNAERSKLVEVGFNPVLALSEFLHKRGRFSSRASSRTTALFWGQSVLRRERPENTSSSSREARW